MSFEPNYEKVINNYKRKIGEMQSQLMCKLPCIEGFLPERVLSLCGNIGSVRGNINGNVINFDGEVNIKALYITNNGEYKEIEYTIDFKDRYMLEKETNFAELIISAEICEIKASIDGMDIKVDGIVNIALQGIIAETMNVLVSVKGDNAYTKCEDMEYCSFDGVANESFEVASDIEIKDSVEEVLFVSPSAIISKVESYDNFVKVYGEVITKVAYISSGASPVVRLCENSIDFMQECVLSNMSEKSVVDSIINCVYKNINITSNIGEDKSILNVIIPIEYSGYVWSEKSIQVVTDIYCTKNELDQKSNACNFQKKCLTKNYIENINASVSIDENDLMIDEILGNYSNRVVVVNTRVNDEIVTIDGILYSSVLYRNAEFNTTANYDIQLPFSIDLKVDNLKADDNVFVDIKIIKVLTKARRGTEIEVNCSLSINVFVCETALDNVISSVEVLGDKIIDCDNLVIYIAQKDDTIWDIAKKMNVSEDMILLQNPNINLPIIENDRIVIYKQKIAQQ